MRTIQTLAEEVKRGLHTALPRLRKPVVNTLSLAMGALIEAQTPNTTEVAKVLPLPSERQDRREPWLRRLLKTPLLVSPAILQPFARTVREEGARDAQRVMRSLDQTDLGERFAGVMLAVQVGDRSLPLAWWVEAGAANIGFAGHSRRLERVRVGLPTGAVGGAILSLSRAVGLVAPGWLAVPPAVEG